MRTVARSDVPGFRHVQQTADEAGRQAREEKADAGSTIARYNSKTPEKAAKPKTTPRKAAPPSVAKPEVLKLEGSWIDNTRKSFQKPGTLAGHGAGGMSSPILEYGKPPKRDNWFARAGMMVGFIVWIPSAFCALILLDLISASATTAHLLILVSMISFVAGGAWLGYTLIRRR